MMKAVNSKYFYFIALLCCSSINLFGQDTSLMVHSSQEQQQYDFFSKETISQSYLPLTNRSLLQAGVSLTGGDFKLSQDPSKQKQFFFDTEGTKKVGKYLISGTFRYDYYVQDSLAFTLRNDPDDTAPYYFYAAKNGNWEKGKYTLQGIVSRLTNNKKWGIAVGANYLANNAWRSNDPRPEYFSHAMKGSASVRYNFLKNQSVAIAGNIHRKSSETNIEYRNENYSLSLLYADYVNYMQYGYGFSAVQTTGRRIRSNTDGWGWNALYHGSFPIGDFTLKGGYTLLNSHYIKPAVGTETEVKYGDYFEDIYNAAFLWQHKIQQNKLSIEANYKNHLGKDFNQRLNVNNYVYSFEKISINPLYGHLKNDVLKYELGVNIEISDLFRADGVSNVTTDYQRALYAVSGAWYKHFKNKNSLKTQAKLALSVPISSEVTEPIQQSNFIKSVVFYDAYYHRSNSFLADLEILYTFGLKNIRPFTKVKGNFTNAQLTDEVLPVAILPGNNRWNISWSIGIIL